MTSLHIIARAAAMVLPIVWWIGPTISWILPDFLLQFLLFTTLLQIPTVAAGTLLLAGAGALIPFRPASPVERAAEIRTPDLSVG